MTREAIEQLRNNQTQLDMDGVMVGVSRQALEEVLAALSAPIAVTDEQVEKALAMWFICEGPHSDLNVNDMRRVLEQFAAAPKAAEAEMKPFSTYPDDRAKLLALSERVLTAGYRDERESAAQELANLAKEILLDEGYVIDSQESAL